MIKVKGILTILVVAAHTLTLAKDKIYQPSTEIFANPERGFYKSGAGTASGLASDRKSKSITLQRTYYHLDAFRSGAISQAYLDNVSNDFKRLREGGGKGIVRFNYNDGMAADAPLSIILNHIGQLKPILVANSDVIAFMEAGFIGAWGEWHHSTSGLDNTESRSAILEKLLASLPNDRMVALRYNYHKRQIYKTDMPLTLSEAYQGTPRSRTGAHNDCLGASEDDWGTYTYNGTNAERRASIEKEKNFLNLDNRWVPQGGETCNPSPYSGCDSSVADLKRMRWDVLNEGFDKNVLNSWVSGGCMDDVKRHLGYRFQLNKATLQDSAKPGNTWSMSLTLVNTGWGKAYNPRSVEIVLRQIGGKGKYYFPIKADPRFWLTGEPVTLAVNAGIPGDMPEGEYKLFLNLPDPVKSLRNRPEYSIRFANPNIWEDSTGFNSLDATVIIKASARTHPLEASDFFTPWGTGSVTGIAPNPLGEQNKNAGFPRTFVYPYFESERGIIDVQGRVKPKGM